MALLKALLIFGLAASLAACNYRIEKTKPQLINESLDADQISFAMVMQSVIGPKCLSCHSSAGGDRGGVNLETYTAVKQQLSDVRSSVADNSMPKNRAPLSQAEKDLLFKWMDAGAKENASTPPPIEKPAPTPLPSPPAEVVLDWETVRKNVIEPTCLRCHAEPKNRGDVNLESYENTLKNLAEVRQTVADGSMPKREKLTEEQKTLILRWIDAGAPMQKIDSKTQRHEIQEGEFHE